jgi:2-keto-4-pentenoate hydratase/2-oxohepta-3-ene-1,7-dioic acid hydratase in catechol pathway
MKVALVESQGQRFLGIPHNPERLASGVLNLSRAVACHCALRDVNPWYPDSLLSFLTGEYGEPDARAELLAIIDRHNLRDRLLVSEPVRFLPPLPNPGKILALGRNYAAHARENGHEPPAEPVFFCKSPLSVIGHEESVVIPPGCGRVDHEVELAVIIGRRGYRVSREKASRLIAGYTILNDVTARDAQKRDLEQSHPWFRSKSFDTFCPLGPWVVTPDEMPDPLHVDLELRVNNEIRQSSNTRYMIFDIRFVLEFITQWISLAPGDILSTGTPDGITPIHPGDIMEATIQGIGTLCNPVVALKQEPS